MTRQLSVRLSEALGTRLGRVARLVRRSRATIAREALTDHIEDLEDLHAARRVVRGIALGRECLIPIDELIGGYPARPRSR